MEREPAGRAGPAREPRRLPRCELQVFPGARHSLAAVVPDALAAAIDGFLTRPADLLPRDFRYGAPDA